MSLTKHLQLHADNIINARARYKSPTVFYIFPCSLFFFSDFDFFKLHVLNDPTGLFCFSPIGKTSFFYNLGRVMLFESPLTAQT